MLWYDFLVTSDAGQLQAEAGEVKGITEEAAWTSQTQTSLQAGGGLIQKTE